MLSSDCKYGLSEHRNCKNRSRSAEQGNRIQQQHLLCKMPSLWQLGKKNLSLHKTHKKRQYPSLFCLRGLRIQIQSNRNCKKRIKSCTFDCFCDVIFLYQQMLPLQRILALIVCLLFSLTVKASVFLGGFVVLGLSYISSILSHV